MASRSLTIVLATLAFAFVLHVCGQFLSALTGTSVAVPLTASRQSASGELVRPVTRGAPVHAAVVSSDGQPPDVVEEGARRDRVWWWGNVLVACYGAMTLKLALSFLPAKPQDAPTYYGSADRLSPVAMWGASGEKVPEPATVNKMRAFAEQYLKRTDTTLCVDKGVAAVVITGLAAHKEELGAPLCPCRNYEDKQAEATQGYWNCPCVPMRERKECHCMLFLTKDNEFAGTEKTISMEEIAQYTEGMGL